MLANIAERRGRVRRRRIQPVERCEIEGGKAAVAVETVEVREG